VLISGAGKITVEFLSTEIPISVCRLRSCSAPILGLDVEDLADVLVDLLSLGQRLIQRVLTDNTSKR
jgi:hypothetical protein